MKQHLPALTGARFVAAAYVVLYHYAGPYVDLPVAGQHLLSAGYVAVSFFFLLSGFVLGRSYLDASGDLNTGRRTFFRARAARIYPIYLVAMLAYLPMFIGRAVADRLSWPAIAGITVANVTLVQAWIPPASVIWNGVGWSLSAEAFFYLAFPFIAPRVARARRPLLVGLALWLLAIAVPAVFSAVHQHATGWPGDHMDDCDAIRFVNYSPITRIPEFLLGVLLSQHFNRLRISVLGPIAAVAAVALLTVRVVPYPVLHNGLLDPLFALVICWLATGTGSVVRMLSTPVFVLLGEASYSLYILQLSMWEMVVAPAGAYARSPWFFPIAFAAMIGLSVLAFHQVERRYRRTVMSSLVWGV